MNCKDCLHYEVCDSGRHIGEYNEGIDEGIYTDGVEKVCPTFKNKANFVELSCAIGTDINIHGRKYRVHKAEVEYELVPTEAFETPDGIINAYYMGIHHYMDEREMQETLKEQALAKMKGGAE